MTRLPRSKSLRIHEIGHEADGNASRRNPLSQKTRRHTRSQASTTAPLLGLIEGMLSIGKNEYDDEHLISGRRSSRLANRSKEESDSSAVKRVYSPLQSVFKLKSNEEEDKPFLGSVNDREAADCANPSDTPTNVSVNPQELEFYQPTKPLRKNQTRQLCSSATLI